MRHRDVLSIWEEVTSTRLPPALRAQFFQRDEVPQLARHTMEKLRKAARLVVADRGELRLQAWLQVAGKRPRASLPVSTMDTTVGAVPRRAGVKTETRGVVDTELHRRVSARLQEVPEYL